MRMMKRFLSGILAFGMILAMCPAITFATDPVAKTTDTGASATQPEAIEVQKIDENGVPNGIPEGATFIQYLSDFHNSSNPLATNDRVYAQVNNAICLDTHYSNRLYVFAGSHTQWGVLNDPNYTEGTTVAETINGVAVDSTKIYLGALGTKFDYGLGVHPSAGNATADIDFDPNGHVSAIDQYLTRGVPREPCPASVRCNGGSDAAADIFPVFGRGKTKILFEIVGKMGVTVEPYLLGDGF